VSALLDASFLVAAADMSDVNHDAALRWLGRIDEPLLIAGPSLGDADALLQRGLGSDASRRLVDAIVEGSVGLVHPSVSDLVRGADLMASAAEYQPRLIDGVLIAMAERLGIHRIATFERRPLAVLVPSGGGFWVDLEP